jgi:kynureninase
LTTSPTDLATAQELDRQDELAPFRDEFVNNEPDLIYLDGNSLGRLPKRTSEVLQSMIQAGWGTDLIRGWNKGWLELPVRVGAKIARLVGAQPDEIYVADSTSVNLFKLTVAALQARPERTKIVSDVFNFPSDLYILQGIIDLMGRGHHLDLAPSLDTITIDAEALHTLMDPETALVCLTHATYKSSFLHDMAEVTAEAHRVGALMLWDISHSVGVVPLNLNNCRVDLAVGCTYKHLSGGPGAPAFLYVRRELQEQLRQPIWGWLGAQTPFTFDLDYTPATDIRSYQVGTPPIISMTAIEPALDLFLEAGIERIRAKSMRQTDYLIALAEQWLLPLGFTLGSPRQAEQRGSHVSLRHPEGYRINRALIEAEPPTVKVIGDFREPDNIRFGIAPLYTTFTEIHHAMHQLKVVAETRQYEHFSNERSPVT